MSKSPWHREDSSEPISNKPLILCDARELKTRMQHIETLVGIPLSNTLYDTIQREGGGASHLAILSMSLGISLIRWSDGMRADPITKGMIRSVAKEVVKKQLSWLKDE